MEAQRGGKGGLCLQPLPRPALPPGLLRPPVRSSVSSADHRRLQQGGQRRFLHLPVAVISIWVPLREELVSRLRGRSWWWE